MSTVRDTKSSSSTTVLSGIERRTCSRCRQVLSLHLFHRDRARASGRYPVCAECINEDRRRARAERNGRLREYERQRDEARERGIRYRRAAAMLTLV